MPLNSEEARRFGQMESNVETLGREMGEVKVQQGRILSELTGIKLVVERKGGYQRAMFWIQSVLIVGILAWWRSKF